MLALYPNAFDGMSVIESNTQGNTQYLLMNYGWDGDYDNGHYSIFNYSIDWAYGLNTNKRMFYNLSTGQLN